MNNDITNFKKKLIYRSQYRGTKEMDKLIGSFVETNINKFDNNDLMDLEKFLDIDDDTLYKFYNNLINEDTLFNTRVGRLFKSFNYKK
jgi:antitoxin CptB